MDDLIFSSFIMASTASPKVVAVNGIDLCDSLYPVSRNSSSLTAKKSTSSTFSETDSIYRNEDTVTSAQAHLRSLASATSMLLRTSHSSDITDSGYSSNGSESSSIINSCRDHVASNVKPSLAVTADGGKDQSALFRADEELPPTHPLYTVPYWQRQFYKGITRTVYPDKQPIDFKALHEERSKTIDALWRQAGFTPPVHVQECMKNLENKENKEKKKSWIRRKMSKAKAAMKMEKVMKPVVVEYDTGNVYYKD